MLKLTNLNLIIKFKNDLTTAIFMFLVAFLNKKIDKIKIETVQLDEWFSQYIELLSKFELWNLRTEIIKIYQSDFMKNLTQKSINYNIMCSSCKKSIKHGTFICSSCNKNIFLCIFWLVLLIYFFKRGFYYNFFNF